jgi:hypothetical protein
MDIPMPAALFQSRNVDGFVCELAVELCRRSWCIREFNFEHVCFVVPQPTLANAFVALWGSPTMRWVNPSLSRGGGERGIAVDFPVPKNWCDMSLSKRFSSKSMSCFARAI